MDSAPSAEHDDGLDWLEAQPSVLLVTLLVAVVTLIVGLVACVRLMRYMFGTEARSSDEIALAWWRSSGGVSIPYEPEEHIHSGDGGPLAGHCTFDDLP